MKALVVYESMFGNTRHIAEAIAEGLRESIPTDIAPARHPEAVELDDVELVVVGAPTHAWGLSSERTRDAAAQDCAKHPDHLLDTSPIGPGVREWLKEQHGRRACRAVAFDTRIDKPEILTGSAARSIQRRLRHAHFSTFASPHSFTVTATAGPLVAGEIERARQWGEAMGRSIAPHRSARPMPDRAAGR
jgi:hypothetical protein